MNKNLEIKRHYKAKTPTVYEAWTKPELFTQWMGPGSVVCKKFECDLRIGGKYEIHMQTEQGIKIAYGEYKEIVLNEKLVFTWQWKDGDFKNSIVTLTFIEAKDGTDLILTHKNLPSNESADHHTLGWNGSFERLESFLR